MIEMTKEIEYNSPMTYDLVLSFSPYYQELINRVVEQIAIEKPKNILDLGSGTGLLESKIIGFTNKPSIIGVDVQTETLNYANKKFKDYDDITFINGDASHLQTLFKDDLFDMVVSINNAFLMQEPRSMISEALRVTTPGGYFLITSPKKNVDFLRTEKITRNYFKNSGQYVFLGNQFEKMATLMNELESARKNLYLPSLDEIIELLEDKGGRIDFSKSVKSIYLETNFFLAAQKNK